VASKALSFSERLRLQDHISTSHPAVIAALMASGKFEKPLFTFPSPVEGKKACQVRGLWRRKATYVPVARTRVFVRRGAPLFLSMANMICA
jgi:hypothetical protein